MKARLMFISLSLLSFSALAQQPSAAQNSTTVAGAAMFTVGKYKANLETQANSWRPGIIEVDVTVDSVDPSGQITGTVTMAQTRSTDYCRGPFAFSSTEGADGSIVLVGKPPENLRGQCDWRWTVKRSPNGDFEGKNQQGRTVTIRKL